MPDEKMPDWNTLVRERLNLNDLSPQQQDETVAELASHLEELCAEGRARALRDSEAAKRALAEVSDWCELAQHIREVHIQEETMNERTRTLWLPGLVTLSSVAGLLLVLQRLGVQPRLLWGWGPVPVVLYLPWLFTLPLFGAAGAYVSRRGGGHGLSCLGASLFPSVTMLCALFLLLPVAFVVDAPLTPLHLVAFAMHILNWVILPGFALLAGAGPFLGSYKFRDSGVSHA